MDIPNAVKTYESEPRKNFRAYTTKSLINLWPHLHRSAIVWTALVINTLSAFISVYTSSLLDDRVSSSDIAKLLLFVTTFTGVMVYVSHTLISWICLVEENNVRRKLTGVESKNASLANIDLPIALSTIGFYIAAPAQIVSILIYAGYVLYRSPAAIGYLILCLSLLSYPIYRFSIWRRKIIRIVRYYRNNLVDEHGSTTASVYSNIVDSYAHSSMEYFWRDTQAVYILRLVVFVFLFFILQFGVSAEHSFSVLVALMLLITSGHLFFNSALNFQEDKVSLKRIKAALVELD